MLLKDKVVVVIGGEGPLGRAVTNKFLSEGAKLALAWYAPNEWAEARELIDPKYQGQFIDKQLDARDEPAVAAFMQEVKARFGGIDALLHMAGFFYAGRELLTETPLDAWNRLLDLNLKTAFLTSKHAIPIMQERGKGRVVFFPASVAYEPKARFGAYSVAKGGLITLAQALREDFKETGITVNCIVPTVMDTFRTQHHPGAEPDKWVKPTEVADLLSLVCADESGALNASLLKVPGRL